MVGAARALDLLINGRVAAGLLQLIEVNEGRADWQRHEEP